METIRDGGDAARAHARWRQRFPAQCDKGDEGEHATAQLLEDLPPSWTVLHRLMPPDNSFDIDHLLIGPAGVVVLDSKNYTGRVRLNDDTLWTGQYPLNRELGAAQRHADHVADA